MWVPDVVFENQISLETAVSTIKKEPETVVEVHVLDCAKDTNQVLCAKSGINDESGTTKILLKQTARLEVNCPLMSFSNFPFDDQLCDFVPVSVKQDEDEDADFQWEAFHLVQGKNLTSTDYDLQVRKSSLIHQKESMNGLLGERS